jgi:hypothetical protein
VAVPEAAGESGWWGRKVTWGANSVPSGSTAKFSNTSSATIATAPPSRCPLAPSPRACARCHHHTARTKDFSASLKRAGSFSTERRRARGSDNVRPVDPHSSLDPTRPALASLDDRGQATTQGRARLNAPHRLPTHRAPPRLLDQPTRRPRIEDQRGTRGDGPRIRCPLCQWKPRAEDRWFCSKCEKGHWNTFDTHGVCPVCAYRGNGPRVSGASNGPSMRIGTRRLTRVPDGARAPGQGAAEADRRRGRRAWAAGVGVGAREDHRPEGERPLRGRP